MKMHRRTQSPFPLILPLLPFALLSACAGQAGQSASRAMVTSSTTSEMDQSREPAPTTGNQTANPQIPTTAAPPTTVATAPTAPTAETAVLSGVTAGPSISSLGLSAEAARAALAAFRISCPSVQKRSDASGLTQVTDWQISCAAAINWSDAQALSFFETHFDTVQIGTGSAFATGYYEPEIAASLTRSAAYNVPIYRRPADLVEVSLGDFADDLKGRTIRGRIVNGKMQRYFDRAAIVDGALDGRGLEIAYAADPAEFFFLQIQGSGRLRLPDGAVKRIGYETQNGRGYVAIGKTLLDRGELQRGQANMQGIVAYLRADPLRGKAVMNENPSWIFFRELTGPGPLGALGLPVTPRVTVAADSKFVPLGAPIFLRMDRNEPNGLWVAQDTGGAIKGANRVDTFWGAGADAAVLAGGMAARGSALLLLPKISAARLLASRP